MGSSHNITAADYDLESRNYKSEDALTQDVIRGLRVAGACIVRSLYGQHTVYSMTKELQPYLKSTETTGGSFWPGETRMLNALVSKSETFAREVVGNRTWQDVSEHFLSSPSRGYWVGQRLIKPVSKPQINNTVAFRIAPKAKDQALHRDDNVHHTWNEHADYYHLGRDDGVGFFVALTETCQANGATRFIPGSHLWDYSIPPPDNNDTCVYAELRPGDCFFILHSTFHGGSANTTEDDYRFVCMVASTRGLLRQEENQYLTHDAETIKRLPLPLQRFMGWGISDPWKGYVELQDPILVLNPDEKDLTNLDY